MADNQFDLMILGSGPAGLTAALYGQRLGLKTVVFGDIPGGSTYMIQHLANFPGYLEEISQLCQKNNTFLIIDEIQTGFCRTGPMFAMGALDAQVDFLTMAKGIAGGFPFGAFAVTEEVARMFEVGDHGGTYCGNPLGCAVSFAVISYLIENDIGDNVREIGDLMLSELKEYQVKFPETVQSVRGKGLLIAVEITNQETASNIMHKCLELGLILNIIQGNIIRIFPALNITRGEAEEGLSLLKQVLAASNE